MAPATVSKSMKVRDDLLFDGCSSRIVCLAVVACRPSGCPPPPSAPGREEEADPLTFGQALAATG